MKQYAALVRPLPVPFCPLPLEFFRENPGKNHLKPRRFSGTRTPHVYIIFAQYLDRAGGRVMACVIPWHGREGARIGPRRPVGGGAAVVVRVGGRRWCGGGCGMAGGRRVGAGGRGRRACMHGAGAGARPMVRRHDCARVLLQGFAMSGAGAAYGRGRRWFGGGPGLDQNAVKKSGRLLPQVLRPGFAARLNMPPQVLRLKKAAPGFAARRAAGQAGTATVGHRRRAEMAVRWWPDSCGRRWCGGEYQDGGPGITAPARHRPRAAAG